MRPFAFGWPTFDPVSTLTLCIVMIVVMIESTGMFLALAEITGDPVDGPGSPAACGRTGSGR